MVGLSGFGVFFLSLLAYLIGHDYPFVGEWFEAKGAPGHPAPPLEEQRAKTVSALWTAVLIYAGVCALSLVFMCANRVRGSR